VRAIISRGEGFVKVLFCKGRGGNTEKSRQEDRGGGSAKKKKTRTNTPGKNTSVPELGEKKRLPSSGSRPNPWGGKELVFLIFKNLTDTLDESKKPGE